METNQNTKIIDKEEQMLLTNLKDALPQIAEVLKVGLDGLLVTQTVISNMVGAVPKDEEPPSKDQMRTVLFALTTEIAELGGELNWKPWKQTDKELNIPRIADEFADILAFTGLLVVYLNRLGISPHTLAQAYATKSKINIQRFQTGY